jgi:hypothetical protein
MAAHTLKDIEFKLSAGNSVCLVIGLKLLSMNAGIES